MSALPPRSSGSGRKRLRYGFFELSLDLFVRSLPLAPPLDPVNSLRTFGQLSQFTRLLSCASNRAKFCHRFPILRDDDGVAARRLVDKPRELRLGFVEIDLSTHRLIINRHVVSGQHVGQPITLQRRRNVPITSAGSKRARSRSSCSKTGVRKRK